MHSFAWLLGIFICGIIIQFVDGVNSVPVETVVEHLIPVMDTRTLAQFGRTHSKFHHLLNGELCQRAPDRLQRIMDYASSLMEEVQDPEDQQYDLALDDGLHSYFMHRNASELLFYLTLFVMDRSMGFRFLLRMRTMYYFVDGVTIEAVDTKYNISSKANKVREWMANHNCTDTELAKRFKAIIRNKWKYTRVLTQWVGVNQVITNHGTLRALWKDMRFVLKKDLLKILMRGSGSYYVFFTNYNWLQVVNIVASMVPPQSVHLMQRLKSFEQAVVALYREIADEYGSESSHIVWSSNVSSDPETMDWLHSDSVSFADLSEVRPDVLGEIMHSVVRMDSAFGLDNSEYENCVMYLCSLRTTILRYIGMHETVFGEFEEEQVRQLLNEVDTLTAHVMSHLYNAPK